MEWYKLQIHVYIFMCSMKNLACKGLIEMERSSWHIIKEPHAVNDNKVITVTTPRPEW